MFPADPATQSSQVQSQSEIKLIAETTSSVNKPKPADGKNKKPVLGALLGGAKK
jgi:hypothetical protein